jgi:hypothetical protein
MSAGVLSGDSSGRAALAASRTDKNGTSTYARWWPGPGTITPAVARSGTPAMVRDTGRPRSPRPVTRAKVACSSLGTATGEESQAARFQRCDAEATFRRSSRRLSRPSRRECR